MKRAFNISILWFIAVAMLSSCQTDFDKLRPEVTSSDTLVKPLKKNKVLVLIVDGARGQSVRDAQGPNLTALTKNATYSWFGLADQAATQEGTWTDMLTGVKKEKHGVTGTSFASNNFEKYPLVFERIKKSYPQMRISTFSYSNVFSDNFKGGTDQSQSFASDADVQTALISELANADAGLVVGVYGGVNTAGATYGYDISKPQYKNAILEFDTYVGNAVAAMKSRSTYEQENWMVIVTSSKGGAFPVTSDNTIFTVPVANTFTVLYHDTYKVKPIARPFPGIVYDDKFVRLFTPFNMAGTGYDYTETPNIPVITNWNTAANRPSPGAIRAEAYFNPTTEGLLPFNTIDFTIEIKVKRNPVPLAFPNGTNGSVNKGLYRNNWPIFFGTLRSKWRIAGLKGWGIGWETDRWRFLIGNNTDNFFFVENPAPADGRWHTFSVVVYTNGAKRFAKIFTDGVFTPSSNNNKEIPNLFRNNIENQGMPLNLGFVPQDNQDPFDGYVSDVRIFKGALSDEIIKSFACDTYITPSHPSYSSMVCYWPCTDGSGGKFKDMGTWKNDFTILKGGIPGVMPDQPGVQFSGTSFGNSTQWEQISDLVCPKPLGDVATQVPNTVDLAPQILSWLQIPPADTWGLDGRVFLNF